LPPFASPAFRSSITFVVAQSIDQIGCPMTPSAISAASRISGVRRHAIQIGRSVRTGALSGLNSLKSSVWYVPS
jgi:hypothetical protein